MKMLMRVGQHVVYFDTQRTGVPHRAYIIGTGATRYRRVEYDMPLRVERRPTGDITARGNDDAVGMHSGGHMRNTRVVADQQPALPQQCSQKVLP